MAPPDKFGIEVNFLTGRYVATFYNDRRQPEWPPHPARLFSALVATWAEDGRDPDERAVLEWLETLAPPAIAASDAAPRKVVSHFVPMNDAAVVSRTFQERKAKKLRELTEQLHHELVSSGGEVTRKVTRIEQKLAKEREVTSQVSQAGNTNPDSAARMLPERRGKQERFFPSVTPTEARVTYLWDGVPPDGMGQTLDRLLARVTRLGHFRLVGLLPGDIGTARSHSRAERWCRGGPAGRPARPARRTRTAVCAPPRHPPALAALYGRVVPGRYRKPADGKPTRTQHRRRMARVRACPRRPLFSCHTGGRTRPVDAFGHSSLRRGPDSRGAERPRAGRHAYRGAARRIPAPAIRRPSLCRRSASGNRRIPCPRRCTTRRAGCCIAPLGPGSARLHSQPLRLTLGTRGVAHLSRLRSPSALVSLRPEVWSGAFAAVGFRQPLLPCRSIQAGSSEEPGRPVPKAWALAEAAVAAACGHVGLPEPTAVHVSLNAFLTGARAATHFPAFSPERGGTAGRSGANSSMRP